VREAAEVLRVERVVGTWFCWTLTRCFVSRVGRYELRHSPSRPVRQPITCAEMVQTKVGGGSAGLEAHDASRGVANSRYRHRCFRVAIIGRSAHYFRLQFSAAAGAYRFLSHAIPVLHQRSRCCISRRASNAEEVFSSQTSSSSMISFRTFAAYVNRDSSKL
jgi:hypothetical protein